MNDTDHLLDQHTRLLSEDPAYRATWAVVQAAPKALQLLAAMQEYYFAQRTVRTLISTIAEPGEETKATV